ncbi:hypothetical protein ABQE45_22965 [Mycobacteroides chelonae]
MQDPVRLTREFEHPKSKVQAALMDTGQWPVKSVGFRPEFGTLFFVGPLPLVGTDYLGRLYCEVTEVIDNELFAIRITAPKHDNSSTRWGLCIQLSETTNRTIAEANLSGVNPQDPNEVVLAQLVTMLVHWIYNHAKQDLDHHTTRDPNIQSRKSNPLHTSRISESVQDAIIKALIADA